MATTQRRTRNMGFDFGSDTTLMVAALIGTFVLVKLVGSKPGSGADSKSQLPSPAATESANESLPAPTEGSGDSQRLIPHAPINMSGKRVLLVGDSLGVGVGPSLEKELRNLGAADFKNISVGGKNIAQFSDNSHAEGKALEKALAEFKPTIVFVSLGTNDETIRRIKGGDPRYFTAANVAKNLVGPNFSVAKQRRKAIARLASKLSGVQTIFIGPPASDPTLWPMDREFRDLLASTWPGNYFSTEAVAPQKCGDRIHLTGSGYKSWASDIARWVRGA